MSGVSYIITVYNKAEFLPFVISALKNQAGDFKKQFISIDDGSTDESLDVLYKLTADLSDSEIIQQENCGPSIATNRGLEVAKYPYIKLVDADDVLSEDGTFMLLQALEETGHGFSYAEAGTYNIVSDKIHLNKPDLENKGNEIIRDPLSSIIKHAIFTPTHTLIKTDLFRESGGCDKRVFIQDYSFVLHAATKTPFVKVNKIVFYAPGDTCSRLTDNVAQILHDLNAALYYFLSENKHLSVKYRRYAAQRATGRALRWARRHNNSVPLKQWLQYLHVKTRIPTDFEKLIYDSCKVFQEGNPIRNPL